VNLHLLGGKAGIVRNRFFPEKCPKLLDAPGSMNKLHRMLVQIRKFVDSRDLAVLLGGPDPLSDRLTSPENP
jgi:hypothetical protein